MKVRCKINEKDYELEIEPDERLLDVLRRYGFRSVKRGCEDGNCGACTVLVDGVPTTSCLYFAARAEGREINTVEGLGTPSKPHPLQRIFAEEGAIQCGYCTPGMILSAKALLEKNPRPSEEEIKRALDGNLCRCTGYVKIIAAIKRASEELSLNVAS
jgi:carbon-monoxide dehydrogenase small subunit